MCASVTSRTRPIWKTSYRLVLKDDEKPFLQGWAIVENTTEQDWNDVNLTLVSGRPISFIMDLYQPLYAQRPVVQPELYASLRPQMYDQDLAAANEEFRKSAESRDAAPADRLRARAPAAWRAAASGRPGDSQHRPRRQQEMICNWVCASKLKNLLN